MPAGSRRLAVWWWSAVKRIGQNRLELALLGLIAVVCAGLSILQYRWTGELSRAERARLRSGLDEQVGHLARAFDDEIRESCAALVPDEAEIRGKGIQEAHRSPPTKNGLRRMIEPCLRGLEWRRPEHGTLKLYGVDGEGRMSPMEWPANWETLRAAMSARMQGGGPPPSAPHDSTLIEIPIFGDSEGRGGPREAVEWVILEVSEPHLQSETLPRLVAEHLNPRNDPVYEASVSWADPGRPVVFSTRKDKSSVASGADATGESSQSTFRSRPAATAGGPAKKSRHPGGWLRSGIMTGHWMPLWLAAEPATWARLSF